MSSRIYLITERKRGHVVRYVRAVSLAAALRAMAEESFEGRPASAEDIVQGAAAGTLDILDTAVGAVPSEDIEPVQLRAVSGAFSEPRQASG